MAGGSGAAGGQIVDRLFIWLGLKTDDVDRGLRQASSKVSGAMKRIATNVVAPVASFAVLTRAVNKFRDHAVSLGQVSKATGMAVESLDAWRGAMQEAGADGDAFVGKIEDIHKKLTDLQGNDTKLTLWQIGIDADKASDDLFLQLSEKMSKLTASGAMRLGEKLGLDRNTVLAMRQGRTEMERLLAVQEQLGLTSGEDAEMADKNRRSLERLKKSYDGFTSTIVRFFLPGLTLAFDKLTSVLADLRKRSVLIGSFLAGLAVFMGGKLLASITTVGRALRMLGISPRMALLLAMLTSLSLIFEDLWVYANGGESALAGLWEAFGTPEEVLRGLNDLKDWAIDMLKKAVELSKKFGRFGIVLLLLAGPIIFLIDLLVRVGSGIGLIIAAILKLGSGIGWLIGVVGKGAAFFFGIGGKIISLIFGIGKAMWAVVATNPIGIIVALVVAAAALIIAYWDEIKEFAIAAWDAIVEAAANFGEFVSNLWDNIVDGATDACKWITEKFEKVWGFLKKVGETVKGIWNSIFGDDDDPAEKQVNITETAAPAKRGRNLEDFGARAEQMARVTAEERRARMGGRPGPVSPAAAQAMSPAKVTQTNNNSTKIDQDFRIGPTTITVPNGNAQDIAAQWGKAQESAIKKGLALSAASGVNSK